MCAGSSCMKRKYIICRVLFYQESCHALTNKFSNKREVGAWHNYEFNVLVSQTPRQASMFDDSVFVNSSILGILRYLRSK